MSQLEFSRNESNEAILRTCEVIKAITGVGRGVKIGKNRCGEHDAVCRPASSLIIHFCQ